MNSQNHIKRLKRLFAKGWLVFGVLIVLIAIVFSVFRALTPWARQYKSEVESHLSTMLGQSVSFETMDTSWYWFHPVLRLEKVAIVDKDKRGIALNQLLIGVNLFSSLWHWKIQPGILYIDKSHLVFRQVDDHWVLDGLNLGSQKMNLGPEAYLALLQGLSLQEKIIFRHITTEIYLQDGTVIPLKHVNLTIQNQNGRYLVKGTCTLNRETKTEFSIFADLKLNPQELNKTKGQFYLSAKSFDPAQWQSVLSLLPIKLLRGKGDIKLWLDVYKGQLSEVQGVLGFQKLKVELQKNIKPVLIDALDAHLGWKRTSVGWEFSGNKIQLQMDGVKWPENAIYVQHNVTAQSYRVFAKHILLRSLFSLDVPWPELLKPILAAKPIGELYDTELSIKANAVENILTGFSDLAWLEWESLPAVSGLSGVIHWQPQEGRIELDSVQTVIRTHHSSPITFTRINTALEWKPLSHGTRVSLEHFLLQNPDLTITASGVMDEPEHYPKSQVHLEAQFSAQHPEQWIKFIPHGVLKLKLEEWLQRNIKQIDKANGELRLDGSMADFPFDHTSGTFSILTYLSGVDLLIARHWPVSRDIDAYLRVNKRNMDVDIKHADLNGVLVDNMNLRLDDIGLDYETLLLHGKLNAAASKIKAYIFATPLKKKLARLKSLDILGLMGLDLKMEIPLYPENDDILIQGDIQLDNNQAKLHFDGMELLLDNLNGSIGFNEHGVGQSTLSATLGEQPVSIGIQRVAKGAQVSFQGELAVDDLSEIFDVPLLNVMKGAMNVNGVLMLNDGSKDMDNLKIQSSLQGVQVLLPKPLGKSKNSEAPLTIQVDFDADKGVRLRGQYADRLSTDLWYLPSQANAMLHRGDIHLGKGTASSPKERGLKISGSMANFDENEWTAALAKLSSDDESNLSMKDKLKWVDMSFDTLNFYHQQWKNVAIKATRLDNHDWSVQVNQKNVSADVRYDPKTNTINGQLARLHIDKIEDSIKPSFRNLDTISPIDIPNLNLTVRHLEYGDVDVGEVAIQSKSTQSEWQLESGQVTTPAYTLALKGSWRKENSINQTDIQAGLQVSNLSQALERWHFKPIIVAKKGEVTFEGGWSGSVTSFSLAKVSGQLKMMLKGGRITDLGSSTDGKIGLGKLLSIFSLQTIPRRLTLDFSDLSKEGYSFDEFKGDFDLKKGIMTTQNSAMDGPVAYVSMKGNVDVVKHLLDLDLYVSPHVMASLPVVATIAGGPIAGIATWAASKIINQGMLRVTGYTYKVTGPWSDPLVQQLSIDKKRVSH